MADYPNADNTPGYDYDPDTDGITHNNARSTGSFTVSNIGTTTVVDADARAGDIVIITANGQKGASMLAGAGTFGQPDDVTAGIYVSSVTNDGFVVTHNDTAASLGSTFYYAIFPSF